MNFGLRGLVQQSIILPLQRKGARLLMKAALFLVALIALLVAAIFLTAAFFIWIDQLAGPLIAALAVAGLYLVIAVGALLFAIYGGNEKPRDVSKEAKTDGVKSQRQENASPENARDEEDRAAVIAEAIVPYVEILRALGWKREEMALLAGAELAKTLPPLTLVGFAIVCGFLIGRMANLKLPFDWAQKKSA
ncbi:phage holin family protein [Methyloferula stellata]|uniref:phage holin family protein n=1 Tax=Methyloferula stellata TaxID=876270 RepID=UPI00037ECA7B|nr:phage holin family protein [Methyloferula stellata]